MIKAYMKGKISDRLLVDLHELLVPFLALSSTVLLSQVGTTYLTLIDLKNLRSITDGLNLDKRQQQNTNTAG